MELLNDIHNYLCRNIQGYKQMTFNLRNELFPNDRRLSQQEILDETVEYYKVNRRAIKELQGSCQYMTVGGDMCAVGRCVDDPKYLEQTFSTKRVAWVVDELLIRSGRTFEQMLYSQYRGNSVKFWTAIQKLHDTAQFWGRNNLTLEGVVYYESIKQAIANNEY